MSKLTALDRKIADNLKLVREKSGLTQPQVASSLDYSYQYYQKMEQGKVSFRVSTLVSLSAIFGVPLSYLTGDEPIEDVDPKIASLMAISSTLNETQLDAVIQTARVEKHGRG